MKQLYTLLLLIPLLVVGQSQDQNYVKTTTYSIPTTTSLPTPDVASAKVTVTYFDGLGRPVQQRAFGQSHTGKDIVTHMEYDAFGRQAKEYLPYVSSSPTLNFDTSALSEVTNYYGSPSSSRNGNPNPVEATTNPYSEKQFEASPLNRVMQQAAPGNAWALSNGHTIKMDYQANTTGEVRWFKAPTIWDAAKGLYTGSFIDNATYPAGELYKTITKDENWTSGSNNTTEEFKDKEGRVVLKRTYNNGAHDTYYIYDGYSNLAYVLPPKATGTITQAILDGLGYQYRYDNRNRLAAKKLPGKQWEYMVYDRLDRIIATGPAYSPYGTGAEGTLVTQYDVFGRVTATGWKAITLNESSRASLQTQATGGSDPFPLSSTEVLTRNYYDNYSFPGAPTVPATVEGVNTAANVRGLATGSWTRVLTTEGAADAEVAYTIYDHRFRPVRTHTTNYLGGYTQSDSQLDFEGKINYTIIRHKRSAADTELTTTEAFTYSPQGRLLTHTHQIGTGVVELLVKNEYDALGQLIAKRVGGSDTSGNTPLQKVDYSYNIRGWLKGINNTDNLSVSGDPSDLFSFKINYNTPTEAAALFNGNIAETFWKTGSDNTLRKYSYTYDALNRLLDATYSKPGVSINNSYGESLGYDANGNIMNLTRYGDRDDTVIKKKIDDLTYTYPDNSNQLTKVADAEASTSGFMDGTNTDDDYAYDANGNMIIDKNKGITSISYNHLNLPVKISFYGGSSESIEYIYNAAGIKVKKQVNTQSRGQTKATDYLSGYQYVDETLQFFPTAEGYVKNTPDKGSNSYSYVYNYTDHLGNVRLSYTDANKVLTVVDENSYFPFGLKHDGYNYIATDSNPASKYKYNGKELQEELGLDVYDYGARNYDPALGRWMNVDPLAEVSRRFSPYAYALNNPVFFIDPDGMMARPPGDFINESGKKIGSDGIDDGKVYVVKTIKTEFDSGAPSAGITKSERNATEDFIKTNSGNTAAFESNDIAYKNSVEIEGSASTRQSMVDIVNQDSGTGGTSDANNREYGGVIKKDGSVVESPAGAVANPLVNTEASIGISSYSSQSTFHSHPSGTNSDAPKNTSSSSSSTLGGSVTTANFNNAPSNKGGDVTNSGSKVNYVFSRGNGTIYIYNNTGVMATVPQKNFVTPKK